MALEPLSPVSPNVSTDGATVSAALGQAGVSVPATYAVRFSYAQYATEIDIQPLDANDNPIPEPVFAQTAAPRIRITIYYTFQLTVPLVNTFIGRSDMVGSVNGRFFTLTSSQIVQLSDGREAGYGVNGRP
jgi:hypothetical protein